METKDVIVYIRINGETRFGTVENAYMFSETIPTKELEKMDIADVLNYEREVDHQSYKSQPKSLVLRISERIRHDAEEANIRSEYHVIIKIGKFQSESDITASYSNAIARALFIAIAAGMGVKCTEE